MKIKAGAWQSLKYDHKEILVKLWYDKTQRKGA